MVVAAGDVYIAWALSNDTMMGGDSVIGCKSINSQVSVFNSENQGPSPKFSTEYSLEASITRSSSSLANGVFRCEFTRPMTFGQGSRQMDLTQPWYWFVATGPLNGKCQCISTMLFTWFVSYTINSGLQLSV
ncbi:domon domain-containing protein frrs1l [Plakobranchus ocellatus]|uniref:Domon domain-containing protein frrs1l n=1 Tax=Plakobranchus ocellatus TaxID=259542 RepID=A0AAV4CNV8_9GAST|nr:domon domain-containing protein frrs1l [Plakobranchus ocellatus]